LNGKGVKMAVVNLVEDENGELILPLTDKIFDDLGWEVGDTVEWKDLGDGSWSITKKETKIVETELVMVECISQFRERYLVEVPKGKTEWALDTVTMQEAKEFSQQHLGETIVSHRVVSEEEAIRICNIDNDYTLYWPTDKKKECFFTPWNNKPVED
jgi:hypothetical protein